jgi:hypothetical protein
VAWEVVVLDVVPEAALAIEERVMAWQVYKIDTTIYE